MKKIVTGSEFFLCIVGGGISALLAVLCFVLRAHLINTEEYAVYLRNGPLFLLSFLIVLLLLVLVKKPLLHIKSRTLFLLFCGIFLIAALYLNLRIPEGLKGDAFMINKHARLFHEGNFEGLTKGYYLHYFPYQLGMVAWEDFLLCFSASNRPIFVMNAFFALLANFFQWRIYRNLFAVPEGEDSLGEKYTILFSFAFLPLLFFTRFAYGCLPGLMLAEGGVHFLLCSIKKRRASLAAVSVLLFTLSYIMKLNYLILCIAVALILLLLFFQEKRKSFLLLAILILFCAQAGLQLTYLTYRQLSGVHFGAGAPASLNTAMGLMPEEEGSGRRGGWYNGYNFDTFGKVDFNEEKASAVAREKIQELTAYWRTHPKKAALFFADKVVSSWCDPLYESVWIGPLTDEGNRIEDPALDSLYSGDHAYRFVEGWMNVLIVLLEGGAALFYLGGIARKKKRPLTTCIPALYLIGGFLYLLIGEANSQYTFMYVYFLIPCAVRGMADAGLHKAVRRICSGSVGTVFRRNRSSAAK